MKQKRPSIWMTFFCGRGDWILRLGLGLLALRAARALACATPPRKNSSQDCFSTRLQIQLITKHKKDHPKMDGLFCGRGDWIFRLGCGLLALRAARALACATPPLKNSSQDCFSSRLQIQFIQMAQKKAIRLDDLFLWSG